MNATAVGGQSVLHIILLALNCSKRISSQKIERCGLYFQPSHSDCAYHFHSFAFIFSKRGCVTSFISSLIAQMVKNLLAMQETWVQSLGEEDPLEKGMAIYSGILSWRILWTEEPGRLWSVVSQSPWDTTELFTHFTSFIPSSIYN